MVAGLLLAAMYQPQPGFARLAQGWHATSNCSDWLVPTWPTWPTYFSPACARAHTRPPARARACEHHKQVNQVSQVGTKVSSQWVSACQPCTNLANGAPGGYKDSSTPWRRVSRYLEVHDLGYRVSASYPGMGWRFSAWSPEAEPTLNYWQWRAKHCTSTHYARGEAPPARRELLGIYLTATEARAACEAHALAHGPSFTLPSNGPAAPTSEASK